MRLESPIEKWFSKNAALHSSKFPQSGVDYVARYVVIKEWLATHCYPLIGAKTSLEDGGLYTDHSLEHFNTVLKYAGELIGIDNEDSELKKLNCYEVYLIIVSILLHDAGNVFGRTQHEKKAFEILQDIGSAITFDNIEKKHIADLAEVHGGKSATGNKDTIGSKFNMDEIDYLKATFRPKLIAAIVRLADEICEDRTRAARYLCAKGQVPKKSEVFHYYSGAITASKVDYRGRNIRITFDVMTAQLKDKMGKLDEEVFLIDEIFTRIEKMHCERLYCSRFFQGVVAVDSIRVTINIRTDDFELFDTITIDTDVGYPSASLNLSSRYDKWCGDILKERVLSIESGE